MAYYAFTGLPLCAPRLQGQPRLRPPRRILPADNFRDDEACPVRAVIRGRSGGAVPTMRVGSHQMRLA